MTRTILQLCADTGSDTWPYRCDPGYEVITVGADIGVQNYSPDRPIHGIIANPVCTEFSNVRRGKPGEHYPHETDHAKGLELVVHCLRVIAEAKPEWWVVENPGTGTLNRFLGKPRFVYQPWWYGSPWTKKTALWGQFTPPLASCIRRKGWTVSKVFGSVRAGIFPRSLTCISRRFA